MSTHLQRVHKLELKVARVLEMPKGSKQRRHAFVQLQDASDFKNNRRVLEVQSGLLIPKYRKTNRRPEDFRACLHCKGLYLRRLVARHAKTCPQNTEGSPQERSGCTDGQIDVASQQIVTHIVLLERAE